MLFLELVGRNFCEKASMRVVLVLSIGFNKYVL